MSLNLSPDREAALAALAAEGGEDGGAAEAEESSVKADSDVEDNFTPKLATFIEEVFTDNTTEKFKTLISWGEINGFKIGEFKGTYYQTWGNDGNGDSECGGFLHDKKKGRFIRVKFNAKTDPQWAILEVLPANTRVIVREKKTLDVWM